MFFYRCFLVIRIYKDKDEYLSSLVPQTVSSISRYNLRNENDLQTIKTESTLYYNSFLPSTVRAWNNLPNEAKHLQSTDAFKYYLKKDNVQVPKYYYTGKRNVQILHTRLRTNCSSLNLDLFIKSISNSPLCVCGSLEDTQHYFFHCPNFTQQRIELLNEISRYSTPS